MSDDLDDVEEVEESESESDLQGDDCSDWFGDDIPSNDEITEGL